MQPRRVGRLFEGAPKQRRRVVVAFLGDPQRGQIAKRPGIPAVDGEGAFVVRRGGIRGAAPRPLGAAHVDVQRERGARIGCVRERPPPRRDRFSVAFELQQHLASRNKGSDVHAAKRRQPIVEFQRRAGLALGLQQLGEVAHDV